MTEEGKHKCYGTAILTVVYAITGKEISLNNKGKKTWEISIYNYNFAYYIYFPHY